MEVIMVRETECGRNLGLITTGSCLCSGDKLYMDLSAVILTRPQGARPRRRPGTERSWPRPWGQGQDLGLSKIAWQAME